MPIPRFCYFSDDPHLYRNPDAIPFDTLPAPDPRPESTQSLPSPPPPRTGTTGDRLRDHANRVLRTVTAKLDASGDGTRHYTRCETGFLLGGYIAGGILTDRDAQDMEPVVRRNTTDFSKAWKTFCSAVAAGKDKPVTFEHLENEREAWNMAHQNGTRQAGESNPDHGSATHDDDESAPQNEQPADDLPPAQDLPIIRLSPDVTALVDAGEKAIMALPDGPRLFQRARQLCSIARGVKAPTWLNRPHDAPVIVEATTSTLDLAR